MLHHQPATVQSWMWVVGSPLAGFATVTRRSRQSTGFTQIVVASAVRRRGLGRALFDAAGGARV